MSYDDTRVSRQVYNNSGTLLLAADRLVDRANPIAVQDTTDFLDSGFVVTQRSYLDDNGRVEASYNALDQKTEFFYDDYATGTGKAYLTRLPLDPASNQQQTSHLVFDTAGNVLSQTDAEGNTIRYAYDGLGRVTHEAKLSGTTVGPALTNRLWDYQSPTVTVLTDRNGNQVTSTLNPSTRVRTETAACTTGLVQGTNGGYMKFCDPNGDGTTDSGITQSRTYSLHSDGSLKSAVENWTGGIRGGDDSSVAYVYDEFGRPVSVTQDFTFLGNDGPGSKFVTQYTPMSTTGHLQNSVKTLSLDPSSDAASTFFDLVSTTQSVDPLGHIRGVAQTFVAAAYGSGSPLEDLWGDNALEQVVEIPADRSVGIRYNADGSREKVTRHADATYSNQKSYTDFAYHGDGQAAYMDHWRSPGGTGQFKLLASYVTNYDSRRLLTDRHTVFNPVDTSAGAVLQEDVTFQHDAQGQLTQVVNVRQTSTGTTTLTQDYNYDAAGQPTTLYQLDYDAAGNVIHKTTPGPFGETSYVWDLFGRLIEVKKTDGGDVLVHHKFGYDALGRHIASNSTGDDLLNFQIGTTAFVRDGDAVALEIQLGGPHDMIRRNFLNGAGPGEVLAVDIFGDTVWTFSDLGGTVRSYASVEEVAGTDAWKILHREYTEFGEVGTVHNDGLSESLTPAIWKGELWVPQFGYQFGNRWFDADTLLPGEPESPQFLSDGGGLSGYRLGNNNPNAKVTATRTYTDHEAASSADFSILAWPRQAYHWMANQLNSWSGYFSSQAINSDASVVSASAGTGAIVTAAASGYVHQAGTMLGILDVPTVYAGIRNNYAAYSAMGIDGYTATVLQFHPMAGGLEAWDGVSYQAHEFAATLDAGDRAYRAFNSTLATAGTALGGVAGLRNVLGVQQIESFAHLSSATAQRVRQVSQASSVVYSRVRGAVAPKGGLTMAEGSPSWAGNLVRQYANKVKPVDGFTDVFIHGTRDGKAFSVLHNGKEVVLNQRQIATWLKSQGMSGDIRLISCYSGSCPTGSVAQNLANKLGVKVRAPTDLIKVHSDGTLTAPIGTKWRDLIPGGR